MAFSSQGDTITAQKKFDSPITFVILIGLK